MASWGQVLPGFQIKRWDESNYPRHLPYATQLHRFGYWAQLANYVRLYALLEEGGVYLDTDVEVRRPLDPLLGDGCFVGFEKKRLTYRAATNAIIGAEPGHPFIRANFDAFRWSLQSRVRPYRGVTILNIVLFEHYGLRKIDTQRLGDMSVYDRAVLHPPTDQPPADAYTVHWSQCSWHRRRGIGQELRSVHYKLRRLGAMARHHLGGHRDLTPPPFDLPPRWPPRNDPRF